MCLILTATIQPSGPHIAESDPGNRLAQYEEALRFYTQLPHDILFVENSGFDFAQSEYLQELRNTGRVRFITVPRSSQPEKGKGFQEFEMLDGVIDRVGRDYEAFVKVTGRYIVKNAGALVATRLGDIRIDRHRKMKVAITGFFQCRVDFYQQHLRGIFQKADDAAGVFIEHVLYRRLAELEMNNAVELFPQNPDYHGVSGSHGNSMHRHPLKMKLRNVERRLLALTGNQEFLIEY